MFTANAPSQMWNFRIYNTHDLFNYSPLICKIISRLKWPSYGELRMALHTERDNGGECSNSQRRGDQRPSDHRENINRPLV